MGCVGAYLKSTADMIFAMRLDELYKSVQRSRGLVVCLYRETYDRVPGEDLWHGSVSEVYEGGARYVRGQQDRGEVCGRSD